MTTRETIEAELKQMVFDLLHERDPEELEESHKDALAHIEAAEQANILDSTQATAWRSEIDKAATFSRLLKGDAEP